MTDSNTAKLTILPSSHFPYIKLTCKHKAGTQISLYVHASTAGRSMFNFRNTCPSYHGIVSESHSFSICSQTTHTHTLWGYNICGVHFLHKECISTFLPVLHHKRKILTRSLQTLWTFVLLWVSTNTIRAHGYWSRKFLLSWNTIHNLCLTTVTRTKQHKG